jgi:MFS family permease
MRLFRIFIWGFFISAVVIFFISGYLTYQQYFLWQAHPLSQLLLPPHQPIGYFAQYAFTNFWLNSLIAFGVALIALFATKLLNKRFREKFFWPAEPWIFATAILLVGHPGWIYYTIALCASAILISNFQFLISKQKEKKISFYWLWIPVAILVILITR